jgi:chorismate dehydratase
LCYHKDEQLYKRVQKNFLKRKIKIPQYILQQASERTQIPAKDILAYLGYISYHLDKKAKLGLKKFYNKVAF